MQLIFLYGPPAAGKLTVAREVAKATGLPIFHNHSTVDLLLSLFEFGSPEFVRLRDEIWMSVIGAASAARKPGLIFTFVPEKSVRRDFIERLVAKIESHGGSVRFVELKCPRDEVETRLSNPSRMEAGKLKSVSLYRSLSASGNFDYPGLPEPELSIDTAVSTPAQAATQIIDRLGLKRKTA